MEKKYVLKTFICILVVFILLCFMPWRIDTDIKRYSVQEIDSLINEEYFWETLRNNKRIQEEYNNIKDVEELIRVHKEANTEYSNNAIHELEELIELQMYYIAMLQNFKREDVILTDNKAFERKVYRCLLFTRITTMFMLLLFGYKLYKL